VVVELPEEAKIYLKKSKTSIKILVSDKTSEDDWAVWGALTGVLGSRDDLALKTYVKILEMEKKKISTSELVTLLNMPKYTINKVCSHLEKFGLIEVEKQYKGPITFNYWRLKKKVLGVLRLIPPKYFKNGKWPTPTKTQSER